MARVWWIGCVTLVFVGIFGCDQAAKTGACPEVHLSYRGAIFDNSLVLIIANGGTKPLFNVSVCPEGSTKKYLVSSQLDVGSSVEAGWMELPRGLKKGETIEVYADGYLAPFVARLPS